MQRIELRAGEVRATLAGMPRLSIRIDLDEQGKSGGRLGPGKVDLLEHVLQLGSIAAAGRAMGMSYKRSWDLVAELNAAFGQPVVDAHPGGRSGGGAKLTAFGREVIHRYRAIETEAQRAAAGHLEALQAAAEMRSDAVE